ncbi:MAG TPA: hypothetical protein VF179_01610 [Thermoanaerobaculia bacterium]|nr:hypothetical protein [Thermoanaerobaculia bacterium]
MRQDASNCRNDFKNNRVDCRQVSGASLSTCGTSCPAGYYVDALRADFSNCPNEFKNSRVNCRQVSGNSFSMCGTSCPAGYSVSALRSDPANCSNEFLNNRVDCQKVSGGSLFQCGTACPAGYYVNALQSDPLNCPNEFQNNEVECRQVSGASLSTCGITCPAGYYVNALNPDPLNCSGSLFKNNRVDCRQVSGDFFSMCGTSCPAGYSVSALRPDPLNCSNEFLNNRVDCRKVSGGSLFQCGTSCPAGYYVASLKPDPVNCSNEFQNNEVECRQVNGASLSTCGLSCPAGYYVDALSSDAVNCSGSLFKNNKVDCRQVSGEALSTCGLTCPANYYVDALNSDPADCPNEFLNNRVDCRQVKGGALSTCGLTCPAGYHVNALNSDPADCPNEFRNNRVDCRLTNGDFSHCGTTCPTGYFVSALKPDASNCPNEFLNNRASCEKVQGTTLVTCGSCPPGYSLVGVGFEPDCGGIYNNQANTCRSNTSPGPSIGTQPQSTTICVGQSATLTVTASGQGQNPLSYQWFIGKSPNQTQTIPAATGPSLQVSPSSTTDYWVLVSNSQGQVPSATATVTVNQPAAITAQPQAVTIEAGQPATLTVGATGTSLSYQWYAGQTGDTSHPVPGGTGPSVVVTPRTKTSYWARVRNDCNSVDSGAAEVTVFCTGPSLTRQPQAVSIKPGQPAVLSVGATGTLLSYQWFEGEAGDTSRPVPGGTGPAIEVTPGSTTKYWVRVSNGCGDILDSSAAMVTVCTLPSITGQPQSVSISAGQSATLAVSATGAPLFYQWYEGEAGDTSHPVPGGTGPSFTVSPSSPAKYWVRISNSCGDILDSSAATVTVCTPPAILGTGQPQSVSIVPGESATLAVTATGTSPSYQWYEGPVGSTSNPVPNGTGPSVVVTPGSTASYWVRVSNDCGSTDSNLATVTLISCDLPGSEGMACSGDGNRTCREGQCVCTNCASGVCCGAGGNSYCDGQAYLDPNTGYTGICTSTLPACTAANDFDGANTVYHDGDVLGCVKANGTHQWYPRRPSPRCQEVSAVCGFLCSTHYNDGSGFMCDRNGVWNQSPPLPDCYDGTIPDGWSCQQPPVCVAPQILTPPQSVTIQAGQSATLSTAASGTSPSFRWYRGTSGDTSNLLQEGIADSILVTPSTTASFWVQAFNACGSDDSPTATVTVSPICVPVSISTQPQSVTIAAGQSVTLSAGASGTSPLFYQWYRGPVGDTSIPVPNGTGASVTVSPSTTTSYWVRISNACGLRNSAGATVTVEEEDICIPPGIEAQPQSATIFQGGFTVLSVGASGTSLSYQWYEGTAFDTSNPVPGGTGDTLLVSPASTTSYWVRVANDCGLDDSSTATVTVNGCGPDGTACGGDGHRTCQGGQCVCTDCGSPVCCGAPGNTYCDGQQITDPNYFYTAACTSSLPACGPGNDFNGDDEVYHNGDVFGCVKFNGVHQWFPRRPSPLCQTVAQVCDYLCAYNYNGGMGFQCEDNGFWSQNPPLPYCYDGTIPESFLCD